MCGFFAGVFDRVAAPGPERVAAALDAIGHRGPDGRGAVRLDLPGGRVGILGHVRLALVGVDDGAQPFVGRRIAMVGNGEVYGHGAIRASLEARGARFATRSDNEVALHMAESADGDTSWLGDLRGEWAFAWIDMADASLHAACDPSGARPLRHHVRRGGRFAAVASEAKALLALGVPAELDGGALRHAMAFQYLPSGRTLFAGIGMLPPGCALSVPSGGDASVRTHHDPFAPVEPSAEVAHALRRGDRPRLAALVGDALADAVGARIPDEVSFATHLSGGIDSAAVLAMAARATGRHDVEAFCAAFPWGDDEVAAAAVTANAVGARLVPVEMRLPALLDAMDLAPVHAEGPVMNAHAGAKVLIARAVRGRGHRCVLTGEGADEAFWGYEHLRADLPPGTVPGTGDVDGTTRGVHRPDGPGCDLDALRAEIGGIPTFVAAKSSAEAFLSAAFGPRLLATPRDPARLAADLPGTWRRSLRGLGLADAARGLWEVHALSGYILRGLDDAQGMAHAVESRLPFLDPAVRRLAASVPARHHYGAGGIEKGLLREALEGILPTEVLRRPKRPFMAPALTETPPGLAWARARILEGPLAPSGLFRRDGLEALLSAPPRPLREACLLRLATLSTFLQEFRLS